MLWKSFLSILFMAPIPKPWGFLPRPHHILRTLNFSSLGFPQLSALYLPLMLSLFFDAFPREVLPGPILEEFPFSR
ncbi:hypothetical protein P171DRAFT_142158 [Karstenula rhodostoma CBS 690.94]|uniref:Uncharacterized protein n=1 Tax=Karstenula rhodostoma CBS 690.94 TaxID=1392251 RepID=A0A9P4UIE7_9PLEO|nr:hypothetical protein P171DRAFT_142158 [Karstenula rhodostoma CBS 690.94]